MRGLLQLECMFMSLSLSFPTLDLRPLSKSEQAYATGFVPQAAAVISCPLHLSQVDQILQGYIDSTRTKNHVFGEIRERFMLPSKK